MHEFIIQLQKSLYEGAIWGIRSILFSFCGMQALRILQRRYGAIFVLRRAE